MFKIQAADADAQPVPAADRSLPARLCEVSIPQLNAADGGSKVKAAVSEAQAVLQSPTSTSTSPPPAEAGAAAPEGSSTATAVFAVSPWLERWLAEQQEGGRLSHRRGSDSFVASAIKPAFASVIPAAEAWRAAAACRACGGSGIPAAIVAAVGLCSPPLTLVLPVGDLATLQSLGWEGVGAPRAALRDCLQVWPGTTAAQLCEILKSPPHERLSGELVQATALSVSWSRAAAPPRAAAAAAASAAAAVVRQLRSNEAIGAGCHVVAIETTRRPVPMWQGEGKGAAGAGAGAKLPSVQFGDLRSKNRKGK
ncbi:hypothetical protein JKP88DRAFT_275995 [Tribonema minus]|uniref:Uncharacterized protein n=1 Tax=Tribonema minus TaxID=303371 RepID=A0A836CLS2_9STRA|nr:hypothetical protein JKP88DRAFT_275995 [Tribonema minus]